MYLLVPKLSPHSSQSTSQLSRPLTLGIGNWRCIHSKLLLIAWHPRYSTGSWSLSKTRMCSQFMSQAHSRKGRVIAQIEDKHMKEFMTCQWHDKSCGEKEAAAGKSGGVFTNSSSQLTWLALTWHSSDLLSFVFLFQVGGQNYNLHDCFPGFINLFKCTSE